MEKLTAASIVQALGGQMPEGNGQTQEARTGRVIRVADLKYLKESKRTPSLYMPPGVAAVAEEMQDFFRSDDFTLEALHQFVNENYVAMGEANSLSALAQLGRAGVQTIANDWYLRTPVSWPEYVQEVSSNKRQEFYAPLHRSSLPKLTRPQEPVKESAVSGEDIELINKKFMGMEAFENELWEDDQTGQIRQRAQSLGEAQRIIEEIWVAGIMLGLTNFTVSDFVVPASQYRTINADGTVITTPFSQQLFDNTKGNRPAAFAQLSTVTFKEGVTNLMNALDPKGIKILVRADHLVVSTQDDINARTLVGSEYWPAVQGLGGQTSSNATAGALAGAFATNVFKNMVKTSTNYFYRDWAWSVGQGSRGPVFQRRTPLEVVQEIPNSGQSFDLDSIRWRSRSRWIMDFIDSRFWWLGNDGSVTGQQ